MQSTALVYPGYAKTPKQKTVARRTVESTGGVSHSPTPMVRAVKVLLALTQSKFLAEVCKITISATRTTSTQDRHKTVGKTMDKDGLPVRSYPRLCVDLLSSLVIAVCAWLFFSGGTMMLITVHQGKGVGV